MSLPFETANFAALKKLASQVFGSIKAAEDRLLQVSASTEENDKAQPEGNPEIRAEFLRWLVTEKAASPTSSIASRGFHYVLSACLPAIRSRAQL